MAAPCVRICVGARAWCVSAVASQACTCRQQTEWVGALFGKVDLMCQQNKADLFTEIVDIDCLSGLP